MSTKLDKIVKTYRSLAQVPALVGAQIHSPNVINTVWSQRNIEKGSTTKFSRTLLLNDFEVHDETLPVDVSSEILTKTSKSQKFKAVLRDHDSKQFLEVWKSSNLIRVVDLAALDVHGSVYADIEFSSFEFSPDERKLLYVAEKKVPKSEPFYKRKKPEEAKDGGDAPKPAPKGEEYWFEQDWGEQLVGKKKSILAEYNIENDTVELLKGLPDNVCVAKPKYSSDGNFIIGISYFTEPRKLGLIYCTNRPSTVFQLDFEGNYVELSLKDTAVKSPVFTPNGKEIVWLQRPSFGPHMACMELVKADFPLKAETVPKTVVEIVKRSKKTTNDKDFYGIYNTGFPKRPWVGQNQLLINTNQKYTINSYLVNIDNGEITELEFAEGSQLIIDTKDDLVLALRRNFLVPDKLVIGKLSENPINWTEITCALEVPEVNGATYRYLDLVAPEGDFREFNALYVGPASGKDQSVPLIVWPHGGPHSAFANYFFLEAALFLSLGYGICLINYRGSIGQGNDSIDFLPGKVGTSDVEDCITATEAVLKQFPWISPDMLFLCGGSHGGFLVTHLSGQYPDKFKCVVARNPVVDVASMSAISDIPDWCYIEGNNKPYTQKGPIDGELLLKMRECSPIVHAHKVKAPTLLQVGSKDLRVPPHQSKEYYCRLKANGVKVRMLLYDDNHPIASVPNEIDDIINAVLWMEDCWGRDSC
ncbi:acylamino-acid-releasing enzyme-like [Anthonomus grandis grandis]|uniref:acylamino-acid-releasing enzyme-like n=1 Tax=Anthonomus grandis grandis TaxID=2921223 RepID=UPI002165C140|nr:acylamino-acid-releasing enzyme-like [Anthonomus grandis grandis]